MRHTLVVGDVFNGCGRGIFPGLRRRWSEICFLVMRTSQMDSASKKPCSSELSGPFKRDLVFEAASFRSHSMRMCFKSAVDALSVYGVMRTIQFSS